MNLDSPKPGFWRKLIGVSVPVLLLMVWTAYFHWQWLQIRKPLHGLPAFFLGLLAIILVNALVRLVWGQHKRGWRWLFGREARRLCLWSALFAISTVVLFYNVERWRGQRAWASVVRQAAQQGENLESNALYPGPVPDAENFARAPLFSPIFGNEAGPGQGRNLGSTNVIARVMRWTGRSLEHEVQGIKFELWLEGQTTDFRPWLDFCRPPEERSAQTAYAAAAAPPDPEPAKSAELLLAALKPYDEAIGQLRGYSARPFCRFPLDYSRQVLEQSLPLRTLNGFTRILRVRASAELALKRTESAFADVQLALRLAHYARQQPWMATSQQRLMVLADALQPVWEGLALRQWNESQLQALQEQLTGLTVIAEYPLATRVDAAALADFCESIIPTRRSDFQVPPFWNNDPDSQRAVSQVRLLYPTGWSLQDQAAIHQESLRFLAAFASQPGPRRMPLRPNRSEMIRLMRSSSDPFFWVFLVPKFKEILVSDCGESYPFAQSVVDLATMACALERHRLANGQYPETLDVLAPGFIAALPADILTGQPFQYRRLDDGRFILYSVGFNRTDDGGQPSPRKLDWHKKPDLHPDLDEGDWVWTYPAGNARQPRTPTASPQTSTP